MKRLVNRFKGVFAGMPRFAVVLLALVVGGAIVLAGSNSRGFWFEAEAGTKTAGVTQVTDGTASGGLATQFTSSSSCTGGQVGTPPNCFDAPPAPLIGSKQWKVIFNDDFNGTSLDTTKWSPCFDWNYGDCTSSFNQGREHYQPSQVQISGGIAHLVAEPLSPPFTSTACLNGSCTYKAGLLSTSRPNAGNGSGYLFPFTYGYVEGRMKYPAVSGMFTAFWMMPTDPDYDYRSEIDIAEILGGDPTTIFMTYHPPPSRSGESINNGDHNNAACPVKNYSTDYVRLGMDWEPTYIAWYIDGVKCGQRNSSEMQIENGPMQMMLHMMVDNNWERDWGLTLPNQTTKASLDVDYVRIYQQQ